jgi:hypothetical protein
VIPLNGLFIALVARVVSQVPALSGKLFYGSAPERAVRPFCNFSVASDSVQVLFGATADGVAIRFSVFADSLAEASNTLEAVTAALHGAGLTAGTVKVRGMHRPGRLVMQEIRSPGAGAYQASAVVMFLAGG